MHALILPVSGGLWISFVNYSGSCKSLSASKRSLHFCLHVKAVQTVRSSDTVYTRVWWKASTCCLAFRTIQFQTGLLVAIVFLIVCSLQNRLAAFHKLSWCSRLLLFSRLLSSFNWGKINFVATNISSNHMSHMRKLNRACIYRTLAKISPPFSART